MNRLVIAMALAVGLAAPVVAQDVTIVRADGGEWATPPGLPEGVSGRVLHGDPTTGPVVFLVRVEAGTVLRPHVHSADEVTVVVSGTAFTGRGERMDEAKEFALKTGDQVTIRAGAPHWVRAKSDCVLVRYCAGPADVTYVDPKDDPRRE